MTYQNQTLKCRDCGASFIWTIGEQEFFAQKGFDKPPVRCPQCRQKRKQQKQGFQAPEKKEAIYQIKCKNCGKESEVSFRPRNPQDILCSECFQKNIEK